MNESTLEKMNQMKFYGMKNSLLLISLEKCTSISVQKYTIFQCNVSNL